jgi:ERCC4-related helicase
MRAFNLPMDAEHMPKLKGLYDLIEQKWDAGIRHIVVYCYHTETQDMICSDLTKKFGHLGIAPAVLSGQTRAQDRQELVDAFNSGEVNVLITNICKSLNLSVGELCIFYSVVTNPSRLLQIASRINRDTSAKVREYVVMAYRGEELMNILNAYNRSENKKKLLGDYADASTDILEVCRAAAFK